MKRSLALVAAAVAVMGLTTLPTSASATAQSALPCWTSFDPPSPNGGAMVHYYKNCTETRVGVCPAYTKDGKRTELRNIRKYADANGVVSWWFNWTVKGAQYTTIHC
ncbi:hypothetical protein [Nonomuraea endophytica]|uniref:Uncharacterized protein n=1 Tax=Nonomuraea endophytica TaxID=714136 RepID=A0A7W8A0U4_9ACTN|nr:hypothetical protein [Nonomuraea endophytica]MBB5076353.1 hypothetical protein [Nonomuraea endophytica]